MPFSQRMIFTAWLALIAVRPVIADTLPASPIIAARSFRLPDFGSIADGTISNTEAFRRAVAAVAKRAEARSACRRENISRAP